MKKYYLIPLILGISFLDVVAQSDIVNNQSRIAITPDSSAYSYTQLGGKVFAESPHYDVAKALYGQIAGLNVYQGAGSSADNQSTLSVHGQKPLILIDGYPRSISEITSFEVESATLLKDAVATALYGVQGANGVLVITTKRGGVSKLKIRLNYQFGLSTKFRSPEFADGYTYANSLNQALVMDGFSPKYNEAEIESFRTGSYQFYYPNVDWMKEITRNASTNHRLNMAFNGGDSKFRYFSMIDYMADNSLIRNQNEDNRYNIDNTDRRLGVRANIDVDITSSTFMSLGVVGAIAESNQSNCSNIFPIVYLTPSAAFPIKNEDGSLGGTPIYGKNNPFALINNSGAKKLTRTSAYTNLMLKQHLNKILSGLSTDVSIGFDYVGAMTDVSSKEYVYSDFNPTILDDGTLVTEQINYGKNSQTLSHESWFQNLIMRSDFEAKLNYDLNLKSHTLVSHIIYRQNSYTANGRNNSAKRQSFIGSAAYNYADRYYIDAVLNYSGTAYLPKGSRFCLYPAVSLGWVISNESIFKRNKVVDYLKLYASVGKSGYDGNLSHELYMQSYGNENAGEYFFTKNASSYWGQAEGNLPVMGITPEQSSRITAGGSFRIFNNRLSLSADWFTEERSSILVEPATVSGVIGIGVGLQCTGVQRYNGIDIASSWTDRLGKLSYSLYVNGNILNSKIIEDNQAFQQYDYLYRKGNAVNQTYGLEYVGIFQNQYQINNSPIQTFGEVRPGDLIYKDQNADGKIDDEDKVRMGMSSIPKFYFGFGFNLNYKDFELNANFQGATGVTVNLLSSPIYKPLINNGNISKTFLSRETPWTPERANEATMPRLTTLENKNNYRNSSFWYRDGSYLKLRNILLSYNLKKNLIRFADMKLYIQATDVFSIDRIRFADPEQLWADYPTTRSFWVGAKFNF